MKNDLKQYFSYRLIKVTYLIFLIPITGVMLTFAATYMIQEETIPSLEDSVIFVFSYLLLYSVLNLLREAMLYLFLQKKFSWKWIFKIHRLGL
jgi:hypothetical protein